MSTNTMHLSLALPADWSTDDRGTFFEGFISELLTPMRLRIMQRLRVTGMEIDLLATGVDSPRTVLVECKAHRDPVPADTITKLLGNVQVRRADHGWLFTSSDLTKDGLGLWSEIQADPDLARRFTWYSPGRIIEILIAQRSVVDPKILLHHMAGHDVGDWTLLITPGKFSWLAEVLLDGLPRALAVFDARRGDPVTPAAARTLTAASHRFSALRPFDLARMSPAVPEATIQAQVARVIPGDTWEDPRPARPTDFVGRESVLSELASFLSQVRSGETPTRTFAILAPSGWGKSSLSLKLARKAGSRSIERCSLTAVDSRSAASAGFVVESLRLALRDAASAGAINRRNHLRIQSLRDPLSSADVGRALDDLRKHQWLAVLIFDQFEELFAKESLFEVFNAVRDLSIDVDARQVPIVLGFAWKTDVSLPQQHPAYHLWHQLTDRRRTFTVAAFGRGEIDRVINRAERALGKRLSRALRSRLAEQCQGLPWLLKKLLVHVLQRASDYHSQYLLLERELDIEHLFKEDLQLLKEDHLRCLKFVASRAPVAVAEVEESFSRDTTNLLINQHLLVRSGMNYVVYWDIFRDYLTEDRVPHIPWSRTFQRTPGVGFKALLLLSSSGPQTAADFSESLGLKEGPTFNLLSDLVALQLVDTSENGTYSVAKHLTPLDADTVAASVRSQLRRHIVAAVLERSWSKGEPKGYEEWVALFASAHPRTSSFSSATLRQYAGNLKGWLVFAGLLEVTPRGIQRPEAIGAQAGNLMSNRSAAGLFLGTSSPRRLEELLRRMLASGSAPRSTFEAQGLRNAVSDALALGLVESSGGVMILREVQASVDALIEYAKAHVRTAGTSELALNCLASARNDRKLAGELLKAELDVEWTPTSASRNLGGLLRYAAWAGMAVSSD